MTLNLAYRLDLFRLSNPFPPTPELFQPIIICLKDRTNKKFLFKKSARKKNKKVRDKKISEDKCDDVTPICESVWTDESLCRLKTRKREFYDNVLVCYQLAIHFRFYF